MRKQLHPWLTAVNMGSWDPRSSETNRRWYVFDKPRNAPPNAHQRALYKLNKGTVERLGGAMLRTVESYGTPQPMITDQERKDMLSIVRNIDGVSIVTSWMTNEGYRFCVGVNTPVVVEN